MKIEKIKITDIFEADYNPRKINDSEFNKLSNSLNEFGLIDPIIINLKNNRIIGGHQRYDVLLDKYMKDNNFYAELNLIRLGDIGWVFAETDLKIKSEDHEKAMNLALNKISGEWDIPKLDEVLSDLKLNNFDLELSGFGEVELTEIENELTNYIEENPQKENIPTEIDVGTTYYEPKENDYNLNDLYEENTQFDDLIAEVKNPDLKKLMEIRKAWFCKFDFKKIADYYSYQATPYEQEIFEKMALVLLDTNQMIENGYLELINMLKEKGDD